jgi:hypothetical protein
MSNAAVLEPPAIEDALFGEPKVFQPEGDFDPDGGCFCVCSCKTVESKTPSSDNRFVDSSACK